MSRSPHPRPVYLDYNATAPLRPEVRETLAAALDLVGNPSSVHGFGRACRSAVEHARAQVAALVGARPSEVVFTSGGTEANNLALRGAAPGRRLVVSAIEHESVLAAAPDAARVPVNAQGVVDLDALDARLAALDADGGPPACLSLMLANNETGVLQPVAEAARLAHARGALVHCDAVQAAGRLPLDRAALGVDLLTLSAHKLGGPQGVGALVVRDGLTLPALLRGGGQERGRRAGTENVAGIAGFGRAAELALSDLDAAAGLAALRDGLERRIRALVPTVRLFGAGAPRLANTSCIGLPGLPGETQVMALDLAGVAVSAGAACSSGKVRASHVLRAMGADPAEAGSAIRVSLGWATGPADIDRFIEAWTALHRRVASAPALAPAPAA